MQVPYIYIHAQKNLQDVLQIHVVVRLHTRKNMRGEGKHDRGKYLGGDTCVKVSRFIFLMLFMLELDHRKVRERYINTQVSSIFHCNNI